MGSLIEDLSHEECRKALRVVCAYMQISSPKMGGNHGWRMRTMPNLIGTTPVDALLSAAELFSESPQPNESETQDAN